MSEPARSDLSVAVVGCGAVATSHYLPVLAASRRAETVLVVDRDGGRARPPPSAGACRRRPTPGGAGEGGGGGGGVAQPPPRAGGDRPAARRRARAGGKADGPVDRRVRRDDRGGRGGRRPADRRPPVPVLRLDRLVGDLLAGGCSDGSSGSSCASAWSPTGRSPPTSCCARRRRAAACWSTTGCTCSTCCWTGWASGPRSATGTTPTAASSPTASWSWRSPPGVAGRVEISRTRNLRNTCLFIGERARLEVGIWDPDPPIRCSWTETATAPPSRPEVDRYSRPRPARAGGGLDFLGAFGRQLDDLAAALGEGRDPFITGAQGRRSIALIEACYAAREPLELPWVPSRTASHEGGVSMDLQTAREALAGRPVFVTGAGGFIGGRLVERLVLECGAEVRAQARRVAGAVRLARFPLEIVRGDVTDRGVVEAAVEGCDVVFHCAYGTRGSQRRRGWVNREGTRRVLEAAGEGRGGAAGPPLDPDGLRRDGGRRPDRGGAAPPPGRGLRRQQARCRAHRPRAGRAPGGCRRPCSSRRRSTARTAACGRRGCSTSSAPAG